MKTLSPLLLPLLILLTATACSSYALPPLEIKPVPLVAQAAPETAQPNRPTIAAPRFSHSSGFHSSEFYLSITGPPNSTIRYTLDGSTPTSNSPIFSSPIRIHSPAPTRENSPMSVGHGFNHYYRWWWMGEPAPPQLYYNGMVVRAVAFSGGMVSPTTTHTFFVERNGRGNFGTRVISISMDPEYFIDPEMGMYHNFNDRTLRHMAYAEIFYPDGTLMFSQHARARVTGRWSRRHPKKSLRLSFRHGDGVVFDMPQLIPDTRQSFYSPLGEVSSFEQISMRISDWDRSTIRDTVTSLVAEPLRPDIQNATYGAVFVNGEFWGMYCLREHRGPVGMAARYPGISPSSIVMLEHSPGIIDNDHMLTEDDILWYFRDTRTNTLPQGHPLRSIEYDHGRSRFELEAYKSWVYTLDAIRFNDMSVHENFEYVKTLLCMDNFIDYFIVYYHFDNWDWPGNNFITWRTETYYPGIPAGDTRWRFFVHDFDEALNSPSIDRTHHFTTTGAEHIAEPGWAGAQPGWAVEIWYSLLQSEEFRNTLAARYSTYLGTVFHPSRTNAIIDRLVEYRLPTIGADFYRWRLDNVHGSVNRWANDDTHMAGVARVRDILNRRGSIALGHLRGYFNRTDRDNLSLALDTTGFTNIRWQTDESMGFFDISGAEIRGDLFDRGNIQNYAFSIGDFNADYIRGLPITVTAMPLDGYAFSHFEVTGGQRKEVSENPMIITPEPRNRDRINVRAVFE